MRVYKGNCASCGSPYEIAAISRFVIENECTSCYVRRTGGKKEIMQNGQQQQSEQPDANAVPAAMQVLSQVPAIVQESFSENDRAKVALDKLRNFPIYTAEQIAIAGDVLQYMKGEWQRIEDRRTSITKPLLEVKRAIDGVFKPALDTLVEAEQILKGKIAQAHQAIQAANFAAQQAAQQHLQQGDARAAALATQNFQPTQAPQGLQFRDVWEWRVVDATQLPREFLTADTKKIAAYVKKHGDKANIPGVVVTKNTMITAGRK